MVVHNGFTREWPSGLRRRSFIEGLEGSIDEAWTARGQWEATTFFIGPLFGDFSDDDIPYFEVDAREAEQIRQMLGVRPKGGPFTAEGQVWVAAHPEDRAAKYLGVAGPEYDAAGRLVKPIGTPDAIA